MRVGSGGRLVWPKAAPRHHLTKFGSVLYDRGLFYRLLLGSSSLPADTTAGAADGADDDWSTIWGYRWIPRGRFAVTRAAVRARPRAFYVRAARLVAERAGGETPWRGARIGYALESLWGAVLAPAPGAMAMGGVAPSAATASAASSAPPVECQPPPPPFAPPPEIPPKAWNATDLQRGPAQAKRAGFSRRKKRRKQELGVASRPSELGVASHAASRPSR